MSTAKFTQGQRVSYVPAGKVARLEGRLGKPVTATVLRDGPDEDGLVSVMADYRTEPGAMYRNMGSAVPADRLTLI